MCRYSSQATQKGWPCNGAWMGTLKTLQNVYCMGARPSVNLLQVASQSCKATNLQTKHTYLNISSYLSCVTSVITSSSSDSSLDSTSSCREYVPSCVSTPRVAGWYSGNSTSLTLEGGTSSLGGAGVQYNRDSSLCSSIFVPSTDTVGNWIHKFYNYLDLFLIAFSN